MIGLLIFLCISVCTALRTCSSPSAYLEVGLHSVKVRFLYCFNAIFAVTIARTLKVLLLYVCLKNFFNLIRLRAFRPLISQFAHNAHSAGSL
jgi:hypothetical protein